MKKAYVVIGANFGDEGKGLMTDYYCRKHDNSLNVRFNGGAQAGHTVVTADGKRHVFSHIGSGTFSNADTYLSEYFIVNPMLFIREYNTMGERFGYNPKVIISPDALVSLPCDMMINQLAENSRGSERHGSCGIGINETVKRSRYSEFSVRYADYKESELIELIRNANTNYVPERLKELGIEPTEEFLELLENENVLYNFVSDFMEMKKICRTCDDKILDEYHSVVFEGAQGLLLDCERTEYFPNLTPSNTGMKNVRAILDKFEAEETEVCYITRSYFTRHGAGKFLSEDYNIAEEYSLEDKTNHTNAYQGNFRYGYFDKSELLKSIELDKKYLKSEYRTAICVTHLDETNGNIICQGGELSPEDLKNETGFDCLYTSYSEISEYME